VLATIAMEKHRVTNFLDLPSGSDGVVTELAK
jgi:hypothetical protein